MQYFFLGLDHFPPFLSKISHSSYSRMVNYIWDVFCQKWPRRQQRSSFRPFQTHKYIFRQFHSINWFSDVFNPHRKINDFFFKNINMNWNELLNELNALLSDIQWIFTSEKRIQLVKTVRSSTHINILEEKINHF